MESAASEVNFSKLYVERHHRGASAEAPKSFSAKKTPHMKEDAPLFEPQICGWYTIDREGDFQGEDKSTLMYLHLPGDLNNVYFDLNKFHGEENYHKPGVKKGKNLNDVLKWIMDQGKIFSPTAPDFVCNPSQIYDIMKVPYQRKQKFLAHGIKIQGTIYLLRSFEGEDDAGFINQGIKFKQYMLSGSPEKLPDPEQPLICCKNKSIRLVMRANIGNHSLLYANKNKGLADAESIMDLQNSTLYDLKTSWGDNYRWYQLLKWWSTSVVGKMDKVVVGVRGENWIVHRLQIIEKHDILRRAQGAFDATKLRQQDGRFEGAEGRGRDSNWRDKKGYVKTNWRTGKALPEPTVKPKKAEDDVKPKTAEDDPRKFEMYNNCFGFLDDFLSHVKVMMKDEDSPDVVYQFFWSCEDEPNFVHCEKLSPEASVPYRFIPDWYAEWLNTCKPRDK